ncbi:hypothetical protein [Diaminobutyricimonas sp. LJ205]|uniref:hypothetical protein n=1 Tax=Diaminobutyricimonas sp. LJ205 TaxID=2683590 RepID=UPI0012F51F3D|nr:hypothetical protein [Diaminobutyricimonas sp. LJ205]
MTTIRDVVAAAEAARDGIPAVIAAELAAQVPPAASAGVAAAIAAQAGKVVQGSGSPNGVVTAAVGTLYVDTAKTLGAHIWRKDAGTGNTGWIVVNGDTGWRNLDATLVNGWTGTLRLRRINYQVQVQGTLTATTATARQLSAVTAGFLPSFSNVPMPAYYGGSTLIFSRVRTNTAIEMDNTTVPTNARECAVSYLTGDAWPTTLPGTAA